MRTIKSLSSFLLIICCLIAWFVSSSFVNAAEFEKEILRNPEMQNYSLVSFQTASNQNYILYQYEGNLTPESHDFSLFPTVTVYSGTASYFYNCHTFAWLYDGNITGLNDTYTFWLGNYVDAETGFNVNNVNNVINSFVSKSCCSIIHSNVSVEDLTNQYYISQLQVGDIIVYLPNNQEYAPFSYIHSAVITNISNSSITVISKWNEFEVVTHDVLDSNFSYAIIPGENQHPVSVPRQVSVYRRSHSTLNNVYPTEVNSTCYQYNQQYLQIIGNIDYHIASCCPYCGLPANVYQSHSFVTIGRFQKCTKCNLIYDPSVSPYSQGGDPQ